VTFSRSVADLAENKGVSPQEEYERVQRISQEWRVHSAPARLALQQHNAAFRCQVAAVVILVVGWGARWHFSGQRSG
jgi:hypothetical protein